MDYDDHLFLFQDKFVLLNFLCGVIVPGAATTCPRSTSSFGTTKEQAYVITGKNFFELLLNISTPLITVFVVSLNQQAQLHQLSLFLKRYNTTSPTVPRPEFENTSSIGIKKVFRCLRCGVGIYESTASINL
jgi:hypothetical protein